jgi:hypothetical protein
VETRLKGYKYFEIERDFFNKLGVLIDGDFKLVYCYLFLFVSLAVIQAIYIEMVFCKESMSRGESRGGAPGARPHLKLEKI